MVDERRELFFFVVICSVLHRSFNLYYLPIFHCSLHRIPPTEKEKNERLLEMARKRFFSDNEFWQCAIAFADVHNTLDEIFRYVLLDTSLVLFLTIGSRLYYAEEKNSLMSQMSSQITSLRQKLISLRQDEVSQTLGYERP